MWVTIGDIIKSRSGDITRIFRVGGVEDPLRQDNDFYQIGHFTAIKPYGDIVLELKDSKANQVSRNGLIVPRSPSFLDVEEVSKVYNVYCHHVPTFFRDQFIYGTSTSIFALSKEPLVLRCEDEAHYYTELDSEMAISEELACKFVCVLDKPLVSEDSDREISDLPKINKIYTRPFLITKDIAWALRFAKRQEKEIMKQLYGE